MSRAPTLSFCMPTYNYGRYIETALDSVRAQASDADVEVLVLDGGSTDGTQAVVERVAAAWPAVRYVRQPMRGGIDADMARSVELATGEFCWLLSADDALQDGALARIVEAFRAGADIVLCNRVWCDEQLQPIAPQAWLKPPQGDRSVDLSQEADLRDYLGRAQSLGALFSFMSCIGFRRESWLGATAPAISCYAHVGRLFDMARRGARLCYVDAALILCRGGMDSFRAGGVAARLLIDLRGYRELAQALFPTDEAARNAFLAVMRREHPLRQWLRARVETADAAQWREVDEQLAAYGFGRMERALVDLVGAPLAALRTAVRGEGARP
jgi:abequosyltransferase